MKRNGNRLWEIPLMLLTVLAVLAGLSHLPEPGFKDFGLRPVNLFSDLLRERVTETDDFGAENLLAESRVPGQVPVVSRKPEDTVGKGGRPRPSADPNVVPIEDYSGEAESMKYFVEALRNIKKMGRPVRIAFVGDSFIEGDILTGDLRENLQAAYGGRGVGFIPLAPPVTYRNTLRQHFRNWKAFSMVNYPRVDRSKLILSGQYFVPEKDASVSVESTSGMEHAAACGKVSLLYSNRGEAVASFRINGETRHRFDLEPREGLQLLDVRGEDIRSLEMTMENADRFVGYGLFLHDDEGIYVDNFSLRSSTGLTLSVTDRERLEEMNGLVKFDLVVLQYGLNVAEPDKVSYKGYKEQMVNVVNHLKASMPETSFLIFGIGDRNFKSGDGRMVTMPGIVSMVETQREIARESGVAFWDTFRAMGGRNSMARFVHHSPPLANKDYTHINYAGGKKLADAFAASLRDALNRY